MESKDGAKYQDHFYEVGNDIAGHYMMVHADWVVHFYFLGNRRWAVEMYSFLERKTY